MLSLVQNMSRKFSSSPENVAHLLHVILVVNRNSFLPYIALAGSCLKEKQILTIHSYRW